MSRTILLLLLPVLAALALSQRRRLFAIIGMGVFSLLLAATYFLSHAPDVAITEAAIGAALVTFIYILAIRNTGRLVVVASETTGLLQRVGDGLAGVEWEILSALAQEMGLDLVVQFVPLADVECLVRQGDADVGAGGLVLDTAPEGLVCTPSHLQTARFVVRGPVEARNVLEPAPFSGHFSDLVESVQRRDPLSVRLDLARFMFLSRHGLTGYEATREEGTAGYTFVVSVRRPEIHTRLARIIQHLRQTGALEDSSRRHLG